MNTGGFASNMELLDWYAGQALPSVVAHSLAFNLRMIEAGQPPALEESDVAKQSYAYAEAMLAEKARREETGKDSLTVQPHPNPDNERWARFQDGIRITWTPTAAWCAEISGCTGYGDTIERSIANLRARWEEWYGAPVVHEPSTTDHSGDANKMVVECGRIEFIPNHSPDAGKMADLQEANRELVEALESSVAFAEQWVGANEGSMLADARDAMLAKARAILAKHKGGA